MRMVKALVNHDVSLNAESVAEGDLTPLHLAALAGRNKIVKFLVLAGASVPLCGWTHMDDRCFQRIWQLASASACPSLP